MLPHRYRKQGAEMLSTLGLNCCVPEASDFFFFCNRGVPDLIEMP